MLWGTGCSRDRKKPHAGWTFRDLDHSWTRDIDLKGRWAVARLTRHGCFTCLEVSHSRLELRHLLRGRTNRTIKPGALIH